MADEKASDYEGDIGEGHEEIKSDSSQPLEKLSATSVRRPKHYYDFGKVGRIVARKVKK